jgi:hypothetical protein
LQEARVVYVLSLAGVPVFVSEWPEINWKTLIKNQYTRYLMFIILNRKR